MGNIKKISGTDLGAFKKSGALVLFCLLSGCAFFPPKPAECTGPYKPINAPVESNVADKTGELDKTLRSDEGAIDGK